MIIDSNVIMMENLQIVKILLVTVLFLGFSINGISESLSVDTDFDGINDEFELINYRAYSNEDQKIIINNFTPIGLVVNSNLEINILSITKQQSWFSYTFFRYIFSASVHSLILLSYYS